MNIIMEVWKIMFLSKWMICRFHVNLPGCSASLFQTPSPPVPNRATCEATEDVHTWMAGWELPPNLKGRLGGPKWPKRWILYNSQHEEKDDTNDIPQNSLWQDCWLCSSWISPSLTTVSFVLCAKHAIDSELRLMSSEKTIKKSEAILVVTMTEMGRTCPLPPTKKRLGTLKEKTDPNIFNFLRLHLAVSGIVKGDANISTTPAQGYYSNKTNIPPTWANMEKSSTQKCPSDWRGYTPEN